MQIDHEALLLNGKFPNVTFRLQKNPEGGGNHVDITAFNCRILLVHDGDPECLVPISSYGKTLAESNQRLFKFAEGNMNIDKDPSEKYLAVLFHSKAQEKASLPSILQLRFPDGLHDYAATSIDLYQEFSMLRDVNWLTTKALSWIEMPSVDPVKEEKISDEAHPQPRKESGREPGA
jgi:hypothetical protein